MKPLSSSVLWYCLSFIILLFIKADLGRSWKCKGEHGVMWFDAVGFPIAVHNVTLGLVLYKTKYHRCNFAKPISLCNRHIIVETNCIYSILVACSLCLSDRWNRSDLFNKKPWFFKGLICKEFFHVTQRTESKSMRDVFVSKEMEPTFDIDWKM